MEQSQWTDYREGNFEGFVMGMEEKTTWKR
jgi:hypothetical protein